MRILLRNHLTGLYYVGLNHMGREHERGLDFGNVRSAAKFTFEEKLPDMEIILRYDSCDGEIPLPVLAEWCQKKRCRSMVLTYFFVSGSIGHGSQIEDGICGSDLSRDESWRSARAHLRG